MSGSSGLDARLLRRALGGRGENFREHLDDRDHLLPRRLRDSSFFMPRPSRALLVCLFMSAHTARALGPSVALFAWQRAIAGMSAYCTATIISSPIDVVKCRMQARQTANPLSMLRKEGITIFWAGIGPAMLMAPAAMVQYTLMDPLRDVMPLVAAALVAGSLDILIKCPFERLKTALQVQVGGEAQQIAASQLMHQTVKAHGILGLWAGLGATLARDMPYLVLKWLTYVQMQGILGVLIPNANVPNLLSGAGAGAVAATAVTPADVIKTRLQAVTSTGDPRERPTSALAIGKALLGEGGVGALFRGLGPRLLRIPIYTAITLATFDFVKDAFQAANELSLKQEL